MSETDLFNQPIVDARKTPKPLGHAGPVGSGPDGETCKTCKHLCRVQYAKTYLKCGLLRKQWTHGPGTDIKAKDAACWKWEGGES